MWHILLVLAAYTFTLDGEPVEPTVYSLRGMPEEPGPGDLVSMGGCCLVLGEAGEWALRKSVTGGLVQLFREETLVFTDVGPRGKPLAGLSDEARAGIRGVRAVAWDPKVAAEVARLPLDRVGLTLAGKAPETDLEGLPAATAYLVLDGGDFGEGTRRSTALRRLEALEVLVHRGLDLNLVRFQNRLRVLVAPRAGPGRPDALAFLTELRELDLQRSEAFEDVSALAKLRNLRRLDIRNTRVLDLRPLSDHPALTRVAADFSRVRWLPGGSLPALRSLSALSTRISDEEAAAFRARNPGCRLVDGWRGLLVDALTGVTSLRIRTGGVCHRDPAKEQVLFVTFDPEQIAKVVEAIGIVDRRSGYKCMCCGDYSFEFMAGHKVLVGLSLHHGYTLRWVGGPWPARDWWISPPPGDASLTPESREALAGILAEHGAPEFLEKFRKEAKSASGWSLVAARFRTLLPEDLYLDLEGARNSRTVALAFAAAIPDPADRAFLWLRMLGCLEGWWNPQTPWRGYLLCDCLDEEVAPGDVAAAVQRSPTDEWALRGAAFWVLGLGGHAKLPRAVLDEVLPALAASGLAHPRETVRRKAVAALEQIGGPAAEAALAAARDGKITLRPLPEEERNDPPPDGEAAPR